MALIVAKRFQVHRKLATGSFGEIYIATDTSCNREVALKFEPIPTRSPQLDSEVSIYHILEDGVGIPQIFWYGCESQFRILAMEYLGESLETLKRRVSRPFSLKTVLLIVDQTLARIEFLHRRKVIHRDVKPDNFLIGQGDKTNLIYLIDFGLSTQYIDPRTGAHIPESAQASIVGTARYSSINGMRGFEQSRRDDLESLGYMWVYLLRGSLPWHSLPDSSRVTKRQQVLAKKIELSDGGLCDGLPGEFAEYFRAVAALGFADEPPYSILREIFRALFVKEGFVCDYAFDWLDAPPALPKPLSWQRPAKRRPDTPKPAAPPRMAAIRAQRRSGEIPPWPVIRPPRH
jgi:serine/threonine protein kinase